MLVQVEAQVFASATFELGQENKTQVYNQLDRKQTGLFVKFENLSNTLVLYINRLFRPPRIKMAWHKKYLI